MAAMCVLIRAVRSIVNNVSRSGASSARPPQAQITRGLIRRSCCGGPLSRPVTGQVCHVAPEQYNRGVRTMSTPTVPKSRGSSSKIASRLSEMPRSPNPTFSVRKQKRASGILGSMPKASAARLLISAERFDGAGSEVHAFMRECVPSSDEKYSLSTIANGVWSQAL